jgi:hypothetical protein
MYIKIAGELRNGTRSRCLRPKSRQAVGNKSARRPVPCLLARDNRLVLFNTSREAKMKYVGLITASALLLASISSAASSKAGSPSADQQSLQGVQEFCSTIVGSADFPLLNWGECISFNVVSERGFRIAFCKAVREGADGMTFEDLGFADFADCVVNLEI